MKFLADENIPLVSVKELQQQGFDVLSASELFPTNADEFVLQYAFENSRVVISFDKDFGELVFRFKKENNGVILLRFSPMSPNEVTNKLLKLLSSSFQFEKYFTVVSEFKIRQIPL